MTTFDTPDPGDLLEIENLTQVFDPINNLEDGSAHWAGTTGGSANAYTASLTPAPSALTAGLKAVVRIHAANTGASTLNLNGLGATAIRLLNAALTGGELVINSTYILIYDGTYWQVIGGGSGGGASELNDLSDVAVTTPSSGQYLRHNGSGDFVNSAIQAGDLPSSIDAAKIANGSVSNTEFQYISGLTSDAQTQIDGKANTSHTHSGSDITSGTVGAAQLGSGTPGTGNWLRGDGAWTALAAGDILSGQLALARGGTGADLSSTGGTAQFLKQTTSGGAVSVGTIGASDLPTGIDATKLADGSVTNTELQYIGGLTSDAQTQLNGKPDLSILTTAGDIIYRNGSTWTRLAIGTVGQVLKVNLGATAPEWGAGGGGASELTDLSDVAITAPVAGHFLRHNGSGDFVNTTIQAGDIPTGVDAAKIADGSISNTEFQYLNNVSSNIQTQLDAKIAASVLTTNGDLLTRTAGVPARLAMGSAMQVLRVNSGGTALEFAAASGDMAGVSEKTADYTLLTADKDYLIVVNSSSNLKITVNGSLDLPVGGMLHILRLGTGGVTIVASGATVNSPSGLRLRAQYSMATLICRTADTYVLTGDTKV